MEGEKRMRIGYFKIEEEEEEAEACSSIKVFN